MAARWHRSRNVIYAKKNSADERGETRKPIDTLFPVGSIYEDFIRALASRTATVSSIATHRGPTKSNKKER